MYCAVIASGGPQVRVGPCRSRRYLRKRRIRRCWPSMHPRGNSLSKSLAVALLLALPLAGCMDAPATAPQQTEITKLGLGAQPAPQLAPDWWKAFGDPQLDRLVDQLLASNPTLQSALARIRAAQAEVASVQSLQYPNINIDG